MAGQRRRREFPEAFKREAVERVRMSGMTIIAVADELGLHETPRTALDPALRRAGADTRETDLDGGLVRPVAGGPRGRERPAEARARPRPHGARHPKKGRAHLRRGHPVSFGFVDEHRGVWPIAVMCAVLGVSVSGYYAWRSRPESRRSVENRGLLDAIRVAHAESGGTYGAPRVHAVLRAVGQRVGRHRVARLMRRAGLRGLAALPRRMRTTDSRHDHPIAPNRIGRHFEAAAPNQVWLGDLTYVRTGEGWLFLAAVLDLHTRKIVGWAMRETLHAEIAVEALEMAVQRQRPAPGLICHTDRGIQYACEPYRKALAAAGITPSMSRKGSCLDNAPMESFFHSLKVERVHHRVYATRAEARRDLFAWIEGWYNTHRLHSALGYRSPAAAERMAA